MNTENIEAPPSTAGESPSANNSNGGTKMIHFLFIEGQPGSIGSRGFLLQNGTGGDHGVGQRNIMANTDKITQPSHSGGVKVD